MQQSIIEAYPDVEIAIYVVWTNRLDGDSEKVAKQAVRKFVKDARVVHFYDPNRRVGQEITKSLGGVVDGGAWDIYLFYDPGREWIELPPFPDEYFHQLTESKWADPGHYHTGDDLVSKLHEVLNSLLNTQ